MIIVNDPLGSSLSQSKDSTCTLPRDIWSYSSSLPGSVVESACVFTYTKTNRGRLKESLLFLRLVSGPIFVGQFRTTNSEIDELIESLGLGLHGLPELDASSLSKLIAALDDCLGCHFSCLEGFPEQLVDERITTWRKSRLVDLAQSNRKAQLIELQDQVDHECAAIERYLKSHLRCLKLSTCCEVAESEQKLPQLTWLQIHNYLSHADPQIARNRRQAILLFPVLVFIAIQKADGGFGFGLRVVIDKGQPIVDYVANQWLVRPVVVRRLRLVGYDDLGPEWSDAMRSLAQILSVIPPEKHPRTRDQWRVFTEQAHLISTVLQHPLGSESVRIFMHHASRRNWGKAQVLDTDLLQQVNNFEAFSSDLGRATRIWNMEELQVDTGMQPRIEAHRLISTMLLSLGLAKLLRIAHQWHAYWTSSAQHQRRNNNNFPVLLDQPFLLADFQIIQLKSAAELESEATEMDHCVDTYVSKCRTGKSVIYSVRSTAGLRCSTFELTINRNGPDRFETRLIQHKGHGNTIPSRGAVKAVNLFLHHLGNAACRHRLKRYDQERRIFNLDPSLANDYQMAVVLKAYLTEKANISHFD